MTLTASARRSLHHRPADGFALRLGLPWIRSLPLASLQDLIVSIDGEPAECVTVACSAIVGSTPAELADGRGWWFLQDRLTLAGRTELGPGAHEVAVTFRLVIPYLQTGPDGPLTLPFPAGGRCRGCRGIRHASPARRLPDRMPQPAAGDGELPAGWMLARKRLQLDAGGDPRRAGAARHRGRHRRERRGAR